MRWFKENIAAVVKYMVFGILALSLLWFVYNSDTNAILKSIEKVGFKFGLILLVSGLAMFMASLAWGYCFDSKVKLSALKLFYIRLIGENVSYFNPTSIVGGEASKVYLLDKEGVSKQESVKAVIVSRGILILTQLAVFIIAMLLFLFYDSQIGWPIFSTSLLFFLIVVIFFRPFFSKILGALNHLEKATKRTWLRKTLGVFLEVLDFISRDDKFYKVVFFSILHWLVGALEIYLLFEFIDIPISFNTALFMDMGIVVLKSFGAFVPGQVGVEEYSNKILMNIIGVNDNATWIFICVLRRTKQLFWLIIGLVVYFLIEQKFKKQKLKLEYGNIVHHP